MASKPIIIRKGDTMNRKEAEEYAKNNMSFREAVYNALQGKCIPYRKATLIKLHELLYVVEHLEGGLDNGD